jgi:hypothetical protein
MKKILYSFLVFGIAACEANNGRFVNVNIYNKTKFEVTLEAYWKGNLLKSIKIMPNGIDSKLVNTNFTTFFGLYDFDIDSTNIKFNNERSIVEFCEKGKGIGFCKQDVNSLFEVYSKQNIGGKAKFTWNPDNRNILVKPIELYITQADYDRAMLIVK